MLAQSVDIVDNPYEPPKMTEAVAFTQTPDAPLSCPGLDTTAPSKLEMFLTYVPFLAWPLAHALCQERLGPLIAFIEQQLRARPAFNDEAWGEEGERREFALFFCHSLHDCLNWPNDNFLPCDPVYIACWAHEDPCDTDDLISVLEGKLGAKLADDDLLRLNGMTLGEARDYLLARHRR